MKPYFFALLTVLALGCARQNIPIEPLPLALNDATPLATELAKRQINFASLSATLTLDIEGTKESIPPLNAELVMEQGSSGTEGTPEANINAGRIRLRAYSPLNQVAFDLLYTEKEIELFLPHRKEIVIIPNENLSAVEFGGKRMTLPNAQEWIQVFRPIADLQTFLAGPPIYGPIENSETAFLHTDAEKMIFEKSNGLVVEMRNKKRLFRYSQHRRVAAGVYAKIVEISDLENLATGEEPKPIKLVIEIKDLATNPKIPAAAFETQSRENLRVTRLEK